MNENRPLRYVGPAERATKVRHAQEIEEFRIEQENLFFEIIRRHTQEIAESAKQDKDNSK